MEIKDYISLNAKATNALQAGHYNRARRLYHSGMDLLEKQFCKDNQDFEHQRRGVVNCRSVELRSNVGHQIASFQNNEGGSFYLYDHAFLAELDETDHLSIQSDDWIILSAVVLYNAAFCYHLIGLFEVKSQLLEKALKMYAAVLGLIQEDDGHGVLLRLASLNNMGHVYSYFCDSEAKQKCLKEVSDILESMNGSDFPIIDFQMNVLFLYHQGCSAASAA